MRKWWLYVNVIIVKSKEPNENNNDHLQLEHIMRKLSFKYIKKNIENTISPNFMLMWPGYIAVSAAGTQSLDVIYLGPNLPKHRPLASGWHASFRFRLIKSNQIVWYLICQLFGLNYRNAFHHSFRFRAPRPMSKTAYSLIFFPRFR